MITDQGLKDMLAGLADSQRAAMSIRDNANAMAAKAERELEVASKMIAALEACREILRAEQRKREAAAQQQGG